MKKTMIALMLSTSFQAFSGSSQLVLSSVQFGGAQQKDQCQLAREAISLMSSSDLRFLIECTPDRYGSYTTLSGSVVYNDIYRKLGLYGVSVSGTHHRKNCAIAREALSMLSTSRIQFLADCERDSYDRHSTLSGFAIAE